jgi:hypothetical protein
MLMSFTLRTLLLILIFILSVAILSVAIHSMMVGNTLGGDYYISYLGGRAALQGEDPYSDSIAIQVQLAMHKQLAGPTEDQVGFAYIPFVIFPLLPILWLPFDWSQAIWMAFTILACFFFLVAACPGRPRPVIFTLLFLYPFAFGVILGNYSIIITAILVWLYTRFTRPQPNGGWMQIAGGLLMAWTFAKPQFGWLFCGFLLLLALRRHEVWFPASFGASLLLLLGGSFLLVPGWPALWLERLQKYTVYNQTWLDAEFFTREFLSPPAAKTASLVLLVALAILGIFLTRSWWRGRFPTLLLWGCCGLFVFLIHPRGKAYEQLVFLLPILTWLLLRPTRRTFPVFLFWGGSLVFSWVAFILQRIPGFPVAIAEAPLIVLPVWLLWMLSRPEGELPADPLQNPV